MKMFNNLPDLFYLGFYHPHPQDNKYFNEYSSTILELKNRKDRAINFFLQEFKHFLINEDIAITTVPPSTSTKPSSGTRDLAQQLVNSYYNFTDAVFCLERFQNSNCNRTLDNHLRTIKVNNPSVIKDKKVILMDDVLTTGSSIQACKKLLIESGVKEVKIIVLGKTMRNVEDAHDFIDQKIDEYLQDALEELDREYFFSIQGYEREQDLEKEKSINEHLVVDEWANDQYSYLDTDEEYDYIEEEIQGKHEFINEIYNEKLTEISRKAYNKYSDFQNKKEIENENCQYIADQAHQVLDGLACFSADNPFIFYFRDW
jgi:hypoxanthine phosphoribosyltransferase